MLSFLLLVLGCQNADPKQESRNEKVKPPGEGAEPNKAPEKTTDENKASDDKLAIRVTAENLLGNPDYPAICFGGYRGKSRDEVPSVSDLTEDMRILHAMGIRVLRTYNTQQFDHAANLLAAIKSLRDKDPEFEMYVMLGAWIDCKGAWSDQVDHENESVENNKAEIDAAVALANRHPDIVKIIAVGNEAMVHWAGSYFVRPKVILHWVKHLQELKKTGKLPQEVWVTSSDNFASWGGGDASYHCEDLEELIRCVDYVSLHTYPFHDTHYNSKYWVTGVDQKQDKKSKAQAAIARAIDYARKQYESTATYVKSVDPNKPLHIGETGWASHDHALYGADGSCAADEYKSKLYYDGMRKWTSENGISCFYFEAFDERWKDAINSDGSENHFGLFTIEGKAKCVLWDLVDAKVFDELGRDGRAVEKTMGGDQAALMESLLDIAPKNKLDVTQETDNERTVGDAVQQARYDVFVSEKKESAGLPSQPVIVNTWEGTCSAKLTNRVLKVEPNAGPWWGCALEIQGDGKGENMTLFQDGSLNFSIRGSADVTVEIGLQTGVYSKNPQTHHYVILGPSQMKGILDREWKTYSVSLSDLKDIENADLKNVTSLLFLRGANAPEDDPFIEIKDVFYSKTGDQKVRED